MRVEACNIAPSDWERQPLAKMCARVTSGGTPSRANPEYFRGGNWCWVKTQELEDRWIDDTEEHITDAAVADSSAKVLPRETVLLALYGATVGQLGILRRPMTCNQACCAVITDPQKADFRFVYYSLLSARDQLKRLATGAAQQNLSGQLIKELELPFPPLPEQRAIAGVLGALDDKIEVNRKMARVLEGVARAVFTSWFVDFDPVRYNMQRQGEAAAYERMGRIARFGSFGEDLSITDADGRKRPLRPEDIHRHVAHLFPNRLVDSPIGEVPEGWKVGTLGDLLSLSRDAIDPGDSPSKAFDHFSIPAFDTGQMPSMDRGETIKSQKFVVTADCVLVSKLNPRTPRVWLPPAAGSRRQVASTEFLVCTGDKAKNVSREFVYCMATATPLIEHLTTHASGTSNSHQRVRPQDFLDFQCVQPPADVLRAFTHAAHPVFGRIVTSRAQSATLAAMRDTLLPKLISGELRIADAEATIGKLR